MDDKIIENIKISLKGAGSQEYDDELIFSDDSYKPYKITRKNFKTIRAEASTKKIAFIDGGSACIINTGDFCVHLIRVFGHIMERNKTISSEKIEFLTFASSKGEDNKIFFKLSTHKLKGKSPAGFTLDSMDNRIKEGGERGKITSLSGIMRRIAEIEIARKFSESMSEGDMILLDGTLEAKFEIEKSALDELYKVAEKNNILLAGLSKDTGMLTKKGHSIVRILDSLKPEEAFYYHPVADIKSDMHKAELFLVRLHKRSEFILRFEIQKDQADIVDFGKVIGLLASISRDISLPGYPYGLVKADRFARVSNSEKEYYQTQIMSRLKGDGKLIMSKDLHAKLDTMY